MKNTFLGSLFLLFSTTLFSQTTKSYSGNFNSQNFKGTSTYNYLEKNEERIFDGSFNFKSLDNKVTISGLYNNNQKNGLWKFNLSNVNHSNWVGNYIITANSVGNFSEGNLVGSWNVATTTTMTIANNSMMKTLTYLFAEKNFDPKQPKITKQLHQATFKDNHFTGNFSYTVDNGKVKVKGKFNNKGYCDSIWVASFYEDGILITEKSEFNNGLLVNRKRIDNSTGEAKIIYDNANEVNNFFKNYNESKNISIVNNEAYELATTSSSKENQSELIIRSIGFWFNNNSIDASSYAYEIKKGTNEMSIYPIRSIIINDSVNQILSEKLEKERLKQEEIEEKETAKENTFNEIKERADRLYSENKLERAKENYQSALNYKNDEETKKKIEQINEKLLQIAEEKKRKDESDYSSYIKQSEENLSSKNYTLSLSNLQKAQKIKNDEQVQNLINSTKETIVNEKIKQADSLLTVKKFFDGVRVLNQAEQYATQNNADIIKSKKALLSELSDLKSNVYNTGRYENITYHIGRGGGFDKNALENYKAMLQEVENISDIELYKQRLKCLKQINDDIFNRLLGDPEGISKDLRKSEKYMSRICK
jgi:hypothetical protein